jgi:hypothetical protein
VADADSHLVNMDQSHKDRSTSSYAHVEVAALETMGSAGHIPVGVVDHRDPSIKARFSQATAVQYLSGNKTIPLKNELSIKSWYKQIQAQVTQESNNKASE